MSFQISTPVLARILVVALVPLASAASANPVVADAPDMPDGSGGGAAPRAPIADRLTREQQTEIQARIDASLTIAPAPGGRYDIVVARNAVREGSYGLDHAGNERPASTSACIPRDLGACP